MQNILQQSQERVLRVLDKMKENSIAIFFSAEEKDSNTGNTFKYRQESSLLYLTDWRSPNAVLVLIKTSENQTVSFFAEPKNAQKELWFGIQDCLENAKEKVFAKEFYEFGKIFEYLLDLKLRPNELYIDFFIKDYQDLKQKILTSSASATKKVLKARDLAGEVRLLKSPDEIEKLRNSAIISQEAHKLAEKNLLDGQFEFYLQGLIEGYMIQNGAEVAYPSIVAGGHRTTILHYSQNDQEIRAGELVLIDAGARYKDYITDITRTKIVGGIMSNAEEAIYNIVRKAQDEAIKVAVRHGTIREVHDRACRIITQGLIDLNVLSGSLESNLENQTYRHFFPHSTCHWIGLDVHDAGSYFEPDTDESRVLKPSMVFTVEPGIYFAPENDTISAELRGIGVRIEDSVLITENGLEVITRDNLS
jgi:Xaa-Pro aminopeptidase